MKFSNGLTIDAENPEMHRKPGFCPVCKVFWYFGGHYCVPRKRKNGGDKSKAYKRGRQGYYDGE